MKPMSAADLKNASGEVVRTLRRGESILLTFRGHPIGTIRPIEDESADTPPVAPFEKAWAEIEQQLESSEPRYDSWKDAEDQSRGRR